MVDIKAVKDPSPNPQAGKPKPKSGVSIPYYNLDQSIAVAKMIHDHGGGSCTRQQLAVLLEYSGTNNGGFLTRISAAKMFGLVSESADSIRVTPLGRKIISPIHTSDAERGKVDAFLGVDFFSKIYENYKNTSIPQDTGLKNLLENTYNVVPGRVVPSLRILKDSAEQAGFFKLSSDHSRMIMPIFADGGASGNRVDDVQDGAGVEREAQRDVKGDDETAPRRNSSGGGDGGGGNIPTALLGLLEKLPREGTPLPPKRRVALTDAFKSLIDFLYPESEDQT